MRNHRLVFPLFQCERIPRHENEEENQNARAQIPPEHALEFAVAHALALISLFHMTNLDEEVLGPNPDTEDGADPRSDNEEEIPEDSVYIIDEVVPDTDDAEGSENVDILANEQEILGDQDSCNSICTN